MPLKLFLAFVSIIATTNFACAEEVKTKSTTGTNIGDFKYTEIDSSDALLDIDHSDRPVSKIYAGRIANSRYREQWVFSEGSGFVRYSSLPNNHYFISSEFDGDGPIVLICGHEHQKICDVDVKKVSRNLILVGGTHKPSGRICAGIIYIDQTLSENPPGSYGDHSLISTYCLPENKTDIEYALKLSFDFASRIKKDGRKIIDLSGSEIKWGQ